ncbi:MAG: DUF3324 domain-containing protein [Saprospiraceae bacterium]|nr:DUF3324 domain-containing protein [Saprospiraceae bacterium]
MKKLVHLFWLLLSFNTKTIAAVMVLNGLTHVHNSVAGGIINGKIVVKNESAKETRILIYKQDLVSNCGKSIEYTDVNKHNRSLGKWLQTNIDEKILQPREEYTVSYSINLPKEEVEKGTYWSVLMIEGADPVKEENNNGMQVNSKVRYAVQVIADIEGFESPKLSFEDVQFDAKEGKTVKIRLKNEGLFSAKTKVSLEVFSTNGKKIKTLEAVGKRIYPNQCNNFEIELKDLPSGQYECIVVADNGKDLFGSNMTLEVN